MFEVSPVAADNPGNSPEPLTFLGRYAHEAVAIDFATNVIYLTENANEPQVRGRLAARGGRRRHGDLNGNEFAGPTFSPDGKILFAGIQSPGHVLAITGPWSRPADRTPARPA